MADFSKVNDELLAKVVATDDLNDALFDFQLTVGINDGGVAALVFSGGWDDEWASATSERRHQMMQHYIRVERSFAE